MLFDRKDESFVFRASKAISSLHQSSRSMSSLRARLQEQLKLHTSSEPGGSEVGKLLELVIESERVLKSLEAKVDSVRFLEEFIAIVNNAANSLLDIKDEMTTLVPSAEKALGEMLAVISSCTAINDSSEACKDVIGEATDVVNSTTGKDSQRRISMPVQNPEQPLAI